METASMSDPERSFTVGGRDQLADLCNELGILQAVEVGTDQGEFAHAFLSRWRGRTLYCIDPYDAYPGMYDRAADRYLAACRLSGFHGRCRFVSEPSPRVAAKFEGLGVGLVYIDARHDYESVKLDIEAWASILIPGGILAGHDFDDHNPGVMRAVKEFAAAGDLQIWLTTDYNQPPSWFVAIGGA
jgi:hypothetical protein